METEKVYDEILQKLPSNELYEEFNSENNYVSNSICKEGDYIKCVDKGACFKLCKKVERNFKSLYEMGTSKKNDERCSHFKYWVYKEIKNLFKSNSKEVYIKDVTDIFINLRSTLRETYGIYNCNYFIKNSLNELNDKIEQKYLYDYFTNYESIKTKEFCNNIKVHKYKQYLNNINDLYKTKKSTCCLNNMLVCPHYFLKCDNLYNPSMLLSELEKNGGRSCDVLKNKSESEIIEKISDPKYTESDIMETFLFTNCHIKNDGKILSCGLVQASAMRDRNRDTNEIHEQSQNNSIDSSETQTTKSGSDSENVPETGMYKSKIVHSDVDGKDKLSDYYEGVDKLIKWKFSKGKPICSGNPSNKDTVRLCKYMEQAHKVGLAKKKDGGGYTVRSGVSWSAKDLKIGREKERTRESAQ
ncbi:hypothetical protein MKS88_001574 [Plasmodium brasilianum]|uniref:Uncharacterized protein n=1 Tax=Plasmodium brasilianum TaxID=5824 RepID=A0ACB9YF17_PLABR|nr:hypothetical protein MKS88_001574 [Plasmodium brasilianum]